ncbi:hypothetical protein D623_10035697 [Myotis brandtii]|uniref:Uncharacterized protein n=1 Tax=Myotis brandtii TaxID=109478 RepID=S7MII5_MYOBR|nr:hypothetical protein D623_10035697 [Myotis brandtii]
MSPSPTAELGNMKLLLQAFFFEDGGGNEHRQIWNFDRYHTEPQWQARLGHLGNFQSLQESQILFFLPLAKSKNGSPRKPKLGGDI